MGLELKIQDKRVSSLVNWQGKFHFTKNELFLNFCKDVAHFLRFFPSFKVSREVYFESPPHKKLEFFLSLVNGWNLLPIVTESTTLDVVEVLGMPLVSEGYVCD